MCTLRELYGPGVEKVSFLLYPPEDSHQADGQLRIDQRVFVTPSNRKLDVNVVQSNYHIELTPS
jgi:replication factor C subunit 3/5